MEEFATSEPERSRIVATSVETSTSWVVAVSALLIMGVAFGAPYVAVVGLKQIALELGSERSTPALAGSLAWVGSGFGGIVMGRIADRVGVRWTVVSGAIMVAIGLVLAASGGKVSLWVGYGVFVGFFGIGGINAPLYVYVSRWFDRRRGTALALISSGAYVAGTLWPALFSYVIGQFGWRRAMEIFAVVVIATIVPAALIIFGRPPDELPFDAAAPGPRPGERVLGWPPQAVLALLALASLCCCVTMSMPQAHLIAFCSDLGILPSHGAAMLSLLLGTAFFSRQFWGWVADRIGGLRTVLAASACQAVAMTGFLLTQDEIGLFTVSAIFGLGFSGLVPAYIVTVRELFPASEAGWRIPTLLMFSGSGMALGSWLAGVIYDHYGFYQPAFATGVAFNIANFAIVAILVLRAYTPWPARSLAS